LTAGEPIRKGTVTGRPQAWSDLGVRVDSHLYCAYAVLAGNTGWTAAPPGCPNCTLGAPTGGSNCAALIGTLGANTDWMCINAICDNDGDGPTGTNAQVTAAMNTSSVVVRNERN